MSDQQQILKSILAPFQTLIVGGANWGDEGKGKIIDKVLGFYDIAARFSGGANAGHTIFTNDGKKLVSHLIPCGLAQNKICVLGRGEFFNAELFLKELEESKRILFGSPENSPLPNPLPPSFVPLSGTTAGKEGDEIQKELPAIYIDQQAALWTPYHKLFEMYIESVRGGNKIGTTNKGIGPLEAIYKLRLSPLVGYLYEPEFLEKSISTLYQILKPIFESPAFVALGASTPVPEDVVASLLVYADKLKPFVGDAAFVLEANLRKGKRVLLEGAQATGLDAWWGTYPYVSSGNSAASGAALGTGLPLSDLGASILVAKILPTRVGNGPMPSELWERQAAMNFAKDNGQLFAKGKERDGYLSGMLKKINSGQASRAEMSQYFQVLGDERGATTGRGRSVGLLDIPWLCYAARINRPSYFALTRFDMLSGVESVPVVVGYKYEGGMLPPGKIPPPWKFDKIETVIETWEGFKEDIGGINNQADLPKTAQKFLAELEKHLKVPILLVGTGPERDAIVVRG